MDSNDPNIGRDLVVLDGRGAGTSISPVVSAADETLKLATAQKQVNDDHHYELVALSLKEVKHNLKVVDELEEEEKRPHLDKLKEIRDSYRPSREAYAKAEAHLKKLLVEYSAKKERLRREAQRQAEEQARKEQEKLRKQADKALAAGKLEKAAALTEQAEEVVAPTIGGEAPKVAGLSFKDAWEFEVVNEELIPNIYKTVDTAKIGKLVSTMKEAAAAIIPGIRVFSRKIPSSTSKQPE